MRKSLERQSLKVNWENDWMNPLGLENENLDMLRNLSMYSYEKKNQNDTFKFSLKVRS